MSASTELDTSTRTRDNAHVPWVEPESCAWCATRAEIIRRALKLQKSFPMIGVKRWSPLNPLLQESATTCACGYAVLRGYLPR